MRRRAGPARHRCRPPTVHRATARGSAPLRAPLTVTATDLCCTSAVELAQLIRRRALSPVELTRTVLDRIERADAALEQPATEG